MKRRKIILALAIIGIIILLAILGKFVQNNNGDEELDELMNNPHQTMNGQPPQGAPPMPGMPPVPPRSPAAHQPTHGKGK